MKIHNLPVYLPSGGGPARSEPPANQAPQTPPSRPSAPYRPQASDPLWAREHSAPPQRPALRAFVEVQSMDRSELLVQGGRLDLYA
ncbi:hypothetical protein [Alkalilimnicola sp. S0819]|uniref:hypothetical protein n=1 Tax=Alkalilimnicola sp. S0819 TaxID=2613922 RepID=UPI001261BF38|nr:hypothetical protein [Alkalilimnicola sp. S0819]KAB7624448.1 hypothetical protein F3N43_06495 [Alkalilimnicola sp. S0819]MPQ16282.1 hypothetical protein [Alkalilimnicola sp. S0819]